MVGDAQRSRRALAIDIGRSAFVDGTQTLIRGRRPTCDCRAELPRRARSATTRTANMHLPERERHGRGEAPPQSYGQLPDLTDDSVTEFRFDGAQAVSRPDRHRAAPPRRAYSPARADLR